MSMARDERGFALPMVLWAIALVGLLVTLMTVMVRAARVEALTYEKHHEADDLVRDGLAVGAALAQQRSQDDLQPWLGRFPHEGEWAFVPCLGGEVWISVTEESGKIDLNKAADALIAGLLQARLAGDRPPLEITAKLLDWRDDDDVPREDGAEAPAYQAAGRLNRPANGPFFSVQELRSVLDLSEEAYASIAPYLTVHGAPTVNPLAASRPVLEALEELDANEVERILMAQALQDPAGDITNILARASGSLSRSRSPVVGIRAAARSPSGTKSAKEVLIQWAGPDPGALDPPPVLVLEERQSTFPADDDLPAIGEVNCL